MLHRRKSAKIDLDQGASFRRSQRFDIVETAKVIAIRADSLGIPHVCFSLKIAGPRSVVEEQRTLSLESFRQLYPDPVAAGG